MIHRSTSLLRRAAVVASLVVLVAASGAGVAFAAHAAITRSEAHAVATAISVRHDDLPTFKEESNPLTAQDREVNARVVRCAGGVPDSEAIADTQSPSFVGPGAHAVTVSSATEIYPSAPLVTKDLAAIRRPRALGCLVSEFDTDLRGSIPKDEKVSTHAARFPSPVVGSDDTYAIRLVFDIAVRKGTSTVTVPLYVDAIGFAYGQAEVSLDVISASVPPTATLERQLSAVLVTRAHSAVG